MPNRTKMLPDRFFGLSRPLWMEPIMLIGKNRPLGEAEPALGLGELRELGELVAGAAMQKHPDSEGKEIGVD